MPIDENDAEAALEALRAAAVRLGGDGLGSGGAVGYFGELARAAPLEFLALAASLLDPDDEADAEGSSAFFAAVAALAAERGLQPRAHADESIERTAVKAMATVDDGRLAAIAFGRLA